MRAATPSSASSQYDSEYKPAAHVYVSGSRAKQNDNRPVKMRKYPMRFGTNKNTDTIGSLFKNKVGNACEGS